VVALGEIKLEVLAQNHFTIFPKMVCVQGKFILYMFQLNGILFTHFRDYVYDYVVEWVVLVIIYGDFEVGDVTVVAQMEAVE
jgi:hypothetical protein